VVQGAAGKLRRQKAPHINGRHALETKKKKKKERDAGKKKKERKKIRKKETLAKKRKKEKVRRNVRMVASLGKHLICILCDLCLL